MSTYSCSVWILLCLYINFNICIFSICRCDALTDPSHRPFFCRSGFFSSPLKTFQLPSYAEGIASLYVDEDFRFTPVRKRLRHHGALRYLDVEAVETDSQMSSYEGSDVTMSPSTSHSISN
jgi:hypothetical protein